MMMSKFLELNSKYDAISKNAYRVFSASGKREDEIKWLAADYHRARIWALYKGSKSAKENMVNYHMDLFGAINS